MILTADVFLRDYGNIVQWSRLRHGSTLIQLYYDDGEMQNFDMVDRDFLAWDSRLPSVLTELVAPDGYLDIALLRLTLGSHWLRANHTVDELSGEITAAVASSISVWRLDSVASLRRHAVNTHMVDVTCVVYKTALTPDGIEYVSQQMTTTIRRPLDWLDSHFKHGSARFAACEALGYDRGQIGAALQERYLPLQTAADPTVTLPDLTT